MFSPPLYCLILGGNREEYSTALPKTLSNYVLYFHKITLLNKSVHEEAEPTA